LNGHLYRGSSIFSKFLVDNFIELFVKVSSFRPDQENSFINQNILDIFSFILASLFKDQSFVNQKSIIKFLSVSSVVDNQLIFNLFFHSKFHHTKKLNKNTLRYLISNIPQAVFSLIHLLYAKQTS
jgi:hypothetical protein